MSVSGSGCPACDWSGRVERLFEGGRPCDRCGGFSHLARALQGILRIENDSPDERDEREALREAYKARLKPRRDGA